MRRRVLVTGASGRTGALVIDRLLQRGDEFIVRALIRNEQYAPSLTRRGVEVVIGDVQQASLNTSALLANVDCVISTMGGLPFTKSSMWRVDYRGTLRLLAASQGANVKHFVFVSTMGLRRKRSLLHPFSILFYPKLLAEDAIRGSGLPYTIVRPGGLVDDKVPQGTRNSRHEVAEVCVTALSHRAALNKIFEISAGRRSAAHADPVFGMSILT